MLDWDKPPCDVPLEQWSDWLLSWPTLATAAVCAVAAYTLAGAPAITWSLGEPTPRLRQWSYPRAAWSSCGDAPRRERVAAAVWAVLGTFAIGAVMWFAVVSDDVFGGAHVGGAVAQAQLACVAPLGATWLARRTRVAVALAILGIAIAAVVLAPHGVVACDY